MTDKEIIDGIIQTLIKTDFTTLSICRDASYKIIEYEICLGSIVLELTFETDDMYNTRPEYYKIRFKKLRRKHFNILFVHFTGKTVHNFYSNNTFDSNVDSINDLVQKFLMYENYCRIRDESIAMQKVEQTIGQFSKDLFR